MTAEFPQSIKSFGADRVDGEYVPAADMNTVRAEIVALETTLLSGGWQAAIGTWTYASATTITVPSGAAAIYSVGDKLMLTQTTVKYFYVVAVADTLLTISGGSSYTLTNAAISANYYSKMATPVGFPQWLNYTPTGISATNVTLTGQFMIAGRMCFVNFKAAFAGGITFTTMPTLPVTASASLIQQGAYIDQAGVGGYWDSGVYWYPNSVWPLILASGTTVTLATGANSTNISATSPITWANLDVIIAHFSYMI